MTCYRAFRNSVQSGTRRIKSGDYPCFLYPDTAVYNPHRRAKGLFRGHIFIRVLYLHLVVALTNTGTIEGSPVNIYRPFFCHHWTPSRRTFFKLGTPWDECSDP